MIDRAIAKWEIYSELSEERIQYPLLFDAGIARNLYSIIFFHDRIPHYIFRAAQKISGGGIIQFNANNSFDQSKWPFSISLGVLILFSLFGYLGRFKNYGKKLSGLSCSIYDKALAALLPLSIVGFSMSENASSDLVNEFLVVEVLAFTLFWVVRAVDYWIEREAKLDDALPVTRGVG